MRFGASQTTYWWIQSILFNYNFLKNLPNLSKSSPYLVGFDWKQVAAGPPKTAAFRGVCVRERARVFVGKVICNFCTVGLDQAF